MTTPNINTILRAAPVNSRRGAPMGMSNVMDDRATATLYLQRIQLVDGDYAADGTYWGGPPSQPLWCAFSLGQDGAMVNRIFVRAQTRAEAKAVLEHRQLATEPLTFFK